jgi:arylsulfatase A-like enzyme
MSRLPRGKANIVDHKHDRWSRDGATFLHEHVTSDNYTHSTDAFTREAIRMVWDHDETKGDGPLFLYLPFTAPHWPTQFWQHHADANRHIPGKKRQEFAGMITQLDESIRAIVEVFKRKVGE